MTLQTAGYLILYGFAFLVFGALAWWLDPEKGLTTLLAGVAAALASILCGVAGARGLRCIRPLAITIAWIVVVSLSWSACMSWLSLKTLALKQLYAPSVATLMAATAALMAWTLIKDRKRREPRAGRIHLTQSAASRCEG